MSSSTPPVRSGRGQHHQRVLPVVLVSLAGFAVVTAMTSRVALPSRTPSIAVDSLVPLTVRFRATVNDAAFKCGTKYDNIGTSHASVTASDFRFYVHDIRLVNAKGDTVHAALRAEAPWQDKEVALLDFEDATATCSNGTPETRDAVIVMAPAGEYKGMAFTLGVPFSRNHEDLAKAPPPLSLSALMWAWQSGHKFLRIDMRATQADSAPTPWVIHLGSAGCSNATDSTAKVPTSCTHPNRATIALAGFNPTRDVVVADLAALLSRADVRKNQPKTAAGCMSADSDADCGALFAAVGLPHASSTGKDTPSFFRSTRADGARMGAGN